MKITQQTSITLKLAIGLASVLLIGAGVWYGLRDQVNANSAAIAQHIEQETVAEAETKDWRVRMERKVDALIIQLLPADKAERLIIE